ncbi:MAG: response regulator [Planctomycetes bacterium]|nr:response regulator [Planctomycetota bacterium]
MSESLQLFLIEDEDDYSYLMRKGLERAGHVVTVCRTAADALIVLGHKTFSLVILDQRLPDMDGLDLLQSLNREGITTPVLMVTGHGDEHLATQVLRAGALDYVVKDRALNFLAELPKRVSDSITRFRLQQMNRLLIEALESARDGIMITDLQGTILHVNQALEKMTGYDRQELLGQNPSLFRSGVHGPDFFGDLWRTVMARASWQGELFNRRKDGTLLDVSLTVSPIVEPRGQLTHFVGIYRDIGERKQMERQLFQAQKMQSVGTLAGGVAHEFNNLLSGIQGYATLGLREKELSPTLAQFLQLIVDLSERAANLTRQLLAFARKPALSRQPTAMEKLLANTAELVRHSLAIEVDLQLPQPGDDPPLLALADANQLQQVLVNLALNARDAQSAPAEIIFRLGRARLEGELPAFPENVPAGDYVLLEVEDRGSGMPAEVLAQALDPFFTTKEIGQGTGLGLPVAFGIVHGHQGFLTIKTQAGVGTCVGIYLPLLDDEVARLEPGRYDGELLEPETGPGKVILVIDDEVAVLNVIQRFLEIAGHQVIPVMNGAQALEKLGRGLDADLVILDLMIPREEGARTFDAIRALRPDLPILLCTGLLQAEQGAALIARGAVDLLRKPFRMNELWYAVNKAMAASADPR